MPQQLTWEKALQKMKHFCAYRERSHYEVKEKLYALGLHKPEVEKMLSLLIEDNYLNETRYATLFAGGHFRQKKWGRKKIEFELKQQKISSFNIKKALAVIDETEYRQTLQQLALKKWQTLRGQQPINKMAKTLAYLVQKGYEPGLVHQQIQWLKQQTTVS